jgi:thiamine pyrophosphokinase
MQINLLTKSSSNPVEDYFMRAVIFANGTFNQPVNIALDFGEDDIVIAADGGANTLLHLGITPDILIGDMDSVQPELIKELQAKGTQLIVYPRDKDQIDLELALRFALDNGIKDIILFGLLGGRLDLSLANLMLLAKDDWKEASLVVADGRDTAYIMHGPDNKNIQGNPGDIVSLIPLTEQVAGVSSFGLRWPLLDADLTLGSTLSISNEIMEGSANIKFEIGKLLLVHRVNQELQERAK